MIPGSDTGARCPSCLYAAEVQDDGRTYALHLELSHRLPPEKAAREAAILRRTLSRQRDGSGMPTPPPAETPEQRTPPSAHDWKNISCTVVISKEEQERYDAMTPEQRWEEYFQKKKKQADEA